MPVSPTTERTPTAAMADRSHCPARPPTAETVADQISSMSCSTASAEGVRTATLHDACATVRPAASTTTAFTFVVPRSSPR